MSRQMGSNITFAAKAESPYGNQPVGNWGQYPIISWDPGVGNDIVDDPSIGFGHREKLDPFRGPKTFKPKLEVPVDLRNIGFWLKQAFGSYAVTGGGAPYTHTFKIVGATALPSFSCETGLPNANTGSGMWLDYTGNAVDTVDLDLSPTGTPKLSLGLIAQQETKNTSTQAGTPTVKAYTPFSQIQGTLDIGTAGSTSPATSVPNLTGATLKFSNALDAPNGVATGGLIIGADPGQGMLTGDVTVRLDATTLYDLATSAGFGALSFGYQIDSNNLLNFVLPRITWGKPSIGIKGPGGVDVKYSWQASRDSGSSASVIATLMNDVTGY